MTEVMVEVGLFLGAIVALPVVLGTAELRPYIYWLELLPSLLLLCVLPFLPESPKFLVTNSKEAQARTALVRFR